MLPVQDLDQALDQTLVVQRLRSTLSSLGSIPAGDRTPTLRLPDIDHHLAHCGLAAGALHEMAPHHMEDTPAALGFTAACVASGRLQDPSLLVVSSQFVSRFGVPYAHGLLGLGLDPSRLIVFRAESHKAALWTIEEALRSRSLASVVALLTGGLDLKASRRIHLAATFSETFLMVLRPADAQPAGAALSRWRIGPAPSGQNRFGAFASWRWRVTLERSRNGRTGSWIMEWDHAAHRVRLAEPLAHPALHAGAGILGAPERPNPS
jgi:protein ImuA